MIVAAVTYKSMTQVAHEEINSTHLQGFIIVAYSKEVGVKLCEAMKWQVANNAHMTTNCRNDNHRYALKGS